MRVATTPLTDVARETEADRYDSSRVFDLGWFRAGVRSRHGDRLVAQRPGGAIWNMVATSSITAGCDPTAPA